ncbi:unnamed protein product [Urochloa humidicola]
MALPVPDDLLADILSRLPLRSLAVCRCVCKAWGALMDKHKLLLPHSVHGLFINYGDYNRPHFFARPLADQKIQGKVNFIVREGPYGWMSSWHEVADHCNGLVLYRETNTNVLYVLNPTTQKWSRLPRCSDEAWGCHRAFLVFDPAV